MAGGRGGLKVFTMGQPFVCFYPHKARVFLLPLAKGGSETVDESVAKPEQALLQLEVRRCGLRGAPQNPDPRFGGLSGRNCKKKSQTEAGALAQVRTHLGSERLHDMPNFLPNRFIFLCPQLCKKSTHTPPHPTPHTLPFWALPLPGRRRAIAVLAYPRAFQVPLTSLPPPGSGTATLCCLILIN